jgi:hypothetical protein
MTKAIPSGLGIVNRLVRGLTFQIFNPVPGMTPYCLEKGTPLGHSLNFSIFRLAPSLSSASDPLGVPCRELLRHGPPGLHANLAQVFMSDYS